MSTQNEEVAQGGHEALMRGDFEELESLMAPDLTWHGWEPEPGVCYSRDEALDVIKERLSQNAIGELREVVDLGDDRVLVVTALGPDSEASAADLGLPQGHDATATLVTIRDGIVVAIQDYRNKDEALEAVQGGHRGS